MESAAISTENSTASPEGVTPGERNRPRKTPASRASTGTPNTITLNLSCSLGAFPASSMIDLTFSGQQVVFQGQRRPDLISCGVISHQTAEALFTFYHEQLDHCVHYILEPDDTLARVRSRSSFLISAICTVSAFCTGSNIYSSCLNALKTEVSRKMFATNHKFDDVRALCIGAFWLSEIASALSGLGKAVPGYYCKLSDKFKLFVYPQSLTYTDVSPKCPIRREPVMTAHDSTFWSTCVTDTTL